MLKTKNTFISQDVVVFLMAKKSKKRHSTLAIPSSNPSPKTSPSSPKPHHKKTKNQNYQLSTINYQPFPPANPSSSKPVATISVHFASPSAKGDPTNPEPPTKSSTRSTLSKKPAATKSSSRA